MSSGKEIKAALAQAGVWGQAVACSDGDALYITNESVSQSIEHLPDDSAGQDFYTASDQGLITCGGAMGAYLRYQSLGVLLALALGSAEAPNAQGGSGYLHRLVMTGGLEGLFGTLAVAKGFSVHEFASVKVDGLTIEGSAGQPVTVSFDLICDGLSLNVDTGANTLAGMTALAAPVRGERVLFRQAAFRLNDASGAALSSGDAIHPSRFSLSLKRGLTGDHLAGNNDKISEPVTGSFPEVSLTLEFPTYTSDTYLSDLGSHTQKKLSIVFTGVEIESGVNFGLSLAMPHLVITNAEAAVDKAGKIAHPVTLDVLAPASEVAGMSGLLAPLALELTNTRDAALLA
ncbi:phage tail tube protein [Desulfoferula mesophila]|uniref:Uncharacterized protein n=1 Tax=Desulfoferula mesophila TaxID=3058419 RepID=A0AAU9F422_9BACT|nr:hypothetical protein FAK_38530 [Desulfoferula mesophilus]